MGRSTDNTVGGVITVDPKESSRIELADDCPDSPVDQDVSTAEEHSRAPEHEGIAAAAKRLPATVLVLLTLTVLIIALLVAGTIMLLDVRSADSDKTRDATVLDTARQVVVNLTTLNHNSVDADIGRILGGTTGSFRDQFSNASGSFRQVLDRGKVDSTGEIKEAGLISSDDDNAQVLVAAASTVKNTDAPNGESRVYRMKVSLQHIDNSWLVSDVEFVA